MTNKIIEDGIKDATEVLNEIEGLPLEQRKGLFDLADGMLTNIKAFVNSSEAWKKINEFEEKIHKDFKNKLDEARKELEKQDSLTRWQDGLSYMMDLRMWKTRETLAFWNKLNQKDI